MECRQILQQYWGYPDFRGIQKDIIESICAGRDTLGLMPTGGGKSITFQVPALVMDGVCIVITPLIALMKDQVDHLQKIGIKAAAIYSGMTRPEIIKYPLLTGLEKPDFKITIVYGDQDIYTTSKNFVINRYPTAQLFTLSNSGHIPWLHHPEAYNDLVRNHYQ